MSGFTSTLTDFAFNGFQNTYGGFGDAFLVKFDSSGNRIWATYYGGNGGDVSYSCAVSKTNDVYLAGYTSSRSDIALNGSQDIYGGGSRDAFLVKFDSLGNRIWATYYGGSEIDEGNVCVTDKAGNIYLAGRTQSSTGISYNGFKNTYEGSQDAFVVKFNSNGNRIWGTCYGGTGQESESACVVDSSFNVYLSGSTQSESNIALNGFKNTFEYHGFGSTDAYLVKFDSSNNRIWATYYGGDKSDYSNYCTVDKNGDVYLAGSTGSDTGIAFNGIKNSITGLYTDDYLVKFGSTGNRLWGTYYGGSFSEASSNCNVDNLGNVYLTGTTNSNSDIAVNGFQNTYGGSGDGFLLKIGDGVLPLHLLLFTAFLQNKAVNLAWQTAQEVNTSYFVVERSNDGISYASLQQVIASSNNGAYTAIDKSPLYGRSLYRLKMVDKDGKVTYSNAVPISYMIKNIVSVSPNPTRDKLTVQLQSISDAKASIRISDVNGKIIYTKQLPVKSGINTLSVPVTSFAKGAYLLTVVQDNDKQTVKWIKE